MRFQIGGGNDQDDLQKLLGKITGDDYREDYIRRETFSWTDDSGKNHTETKTTIMPSKKGAVAGAAAGAALGSAVPIIGTAIGAAIGGIAGFIFGPED